LRFQLVQLRALIKLAKVELMSGRINQPLLNSSERQRRVMRKPGPTAQVEDGNVVKALRARNKNWKIGMCIERALT
jgi:hypothetical protein